MYDTINHSIITFSFIVIDSLVHVDMQSLIISKRVEVPRVLNNLGRARQPTEPNLALTQNIMEPLQLSPGVAVAMN